MGGAGAKTLTPCSVYRLLRWVSRPCWMWGWASGCAGRDLPQGIALLLLPKPAGEVALAAVDKDSLGNLLFCKVKKSPGPCLQGGKEIIVIKGGKAVI